MKKEQPKETPEPTPKTWVEETRDELFKLTETMRPPAWLDDDANAPAWVENATREFIKALFPLAADNIATINTPAALGGLLGHQIAAFNELTEGIEKAGGLPVGVVRVMMPRGGFKTEDVTACDAYVSALVETMKRAAGRAIEANYGECCEFFSAFAKGMTLGPKNTERTNTRLLLFLAMAWREIEKLPSVGEVYRTLSSTEGGKRLVGPLPRFEKLCFRIGLKLKGRGRPKSSTDARKIGQRRR